MKSSYRIGLVSVAPTCHPFKFSSSCSPGCPPCANGKLMQEGAQICLMVTIMVKYNIAAISLSRMATEIAVHPWPDIHVALSREQCHLEPCTGV